MMQPRLQRLAASDVYKMHVGSASRTMGASMEHDFEQMQCLCTEVVVCCTSHKTVLADIYAPVG
jgi:hypothetical protein